MNKIDLTEQKARRSCLLIFGNRKSFAFSAAEKFVGELASIGYYPEKIEFVSFDLSDVIVRVIKTVKANYGNLFIYCPAQMEKTLKDFVSQLYGAEFNALNCLTCDKSDVFLFTDGANRLTVGDVKNALDKKYGIKYDRTCIKTVGAPASLINSAIAVADSLCHGKSVYFNVKEDYGDCKIEIVYSSDAPKMLVDEAVRAILSKLNPYVYSLEDISLAERLYQLLKLRRMKISVAESFTGGGVCKKLVEVAGISEVFFEGLNTYSNEAKMLRLGVSETTLKQQGAVSDETAYQMAKGLINTGNCDVSIATTGIAGPKSDNSSKPVGLAYIAVGTRESVKVYKFNFKGDRETVTKTAINEALFAAYKSLK